MPPEPQALFPLMVQRSTFARERRASFTWPLFPLNGVWHLRLESQLWPLLLAFGVPSTVPQTLYQNVTD